MKKEQQISINEQAYGIFNTALNEWLQNPIREQWLRSCKAKVYETENYYILVSYATPVACIEKSTNILVDVLRTEFYYTATSAQHISKFASDYLGIPKWKATILTTREV